MTLLSNSSAILATVALSLGTAACGDSESDSGNGAAGGNRSTSEGVTVEVFSWWTQPGEAEALQALVDLHKSLHPNDRIYNAAEDPELVSGGEDAKVVLAERLEAGDPPDLFQTNAFDMKGFVAAHPGDVEPLDDLFAAEGLTDVVAPEVLNDVTIDGHIYSVPVNVHRENALFYNKQIFDDHDLSPPETMEAFFSVCETLKQAGVTPVALSTSQAWIINKLFLALAVGSMGPEAFYANFSGQKPFDEAELSAAIELLDRVLADYIDVDAAATDGYGWTQAAQSVFDGEAAMFIHGDWAKGYFMQLGWTPNVDFGVVGSPDAADVFLYGMDVFAVPSGAKHSEAAREFVKTIASEDGQIAFNTIKGSSPMRLDVSTAEFDSMGREVAADFKAATARIPAIKTLPAWDEALAELAKSHDKAALLKVFIDNPPVE